MTAAGIVGVAGAAVLIGLATATGILHLAWRVHETSRRRRARRRRGMLDLKERQV
jgi:hypothetical protein